MKDFLSLAKDSRSVRIYDRKKEVSYDTLKSIINVTRFAPSASNIQPLKYRIVYDASEVDAVRDNTKWAALLEDYDGPSKEESPCSYIVICLDTNIDNRSAMFERDIGIVAQTMALYASDIGLGACMIASFNKENIESVLSLSNNIKPKLILALGYSKQITKIEDVIYGTAYYRDEKNIHHVPKRTLDDIII